MAQKSSLNKSQHYKRKTNESDQEKEKYLHVIQNLHQENNEGMRNRNEIEQYRPSELI